MRRILVSICLCCLSIAPAAARMYQWQNPATGTTQLSGIPPAWYRGSEPGPRVFVFENNQLVDDTGIAVSTAQADALRAAAFGAAAADASSRDTKPAREQAHAPVAAVPAHGQSEPVLEAPDAVASKSDAATAGKAASLKALLDAWDQRQLDQARSLLEMVPSDGKAAVGNH